MKYRTIILAAAILLWCNFSLRAQVDSKGTDFWASFGVNVNFSSASVTLQLRIAASDAANVTITFNEIIGAGRIVSYNIPAGSVVTHTLTSTEKIAVYSMTTGTNSKSVHIESDVPVSVYALNFYYALSDATNLLPIPVLGNDYYHLGRLSTSSASDQIDQYIVVATQNNTDIYENGILAASNLSEGDVYFKQADQITDMSGYHITSNNPVAYFSAHSYCKINGGGDNFFQQLPPVNLWGLNFLVPITVRELELVRIVASQNNTTITQTGGTIMSVAGGQNSLSLNEGEWVELRIPLTNNGCYIQADKPVQVCSYMLGASYPGTVNPSGYGDESLCWIPPIEQTVSSALIAPFAASSLILHYGLIITPTATKNNTTVSIGGAADVPLSGGQWYDNAASGMSFYNVELTNPTDSYLFTNPASLIVYGYGFGTFVSYYYMAGSAMRNLDVAFYVNNIHNQDLPAEVFTIHNMNFRAAIYDAMSANPGHIKWYIDNVEQIQAQDSITWTKNLPNGIYQVRMEVLMADNSTWKTVTSTLTIGSPFNIERCDGDSITLKAKINNGGTTPRFQWIKNGVNIVGANDSTYTYVPTDGDMISCMLISDAICADPDTVISFVITLTVYPIPILAQLSDLTFCNNDISSIISFTGTDVDPTATLWEVISGSGTGIGMSANSGTGPIPSFTAINTGSAPVSITIKVTPISDNGCEGDPDTFTITITPTAIPAIRISATTN